MTAVVAVAAGLYAVRHSQEPIVLSAVPRIQPAARLFDLTPIRVQTTVYWQKMRWPVTVATIWPACVAGDDGIFPAQAIRRPGRR